MSSTDCTINLRPTPPPNWRYDEFGALCPADASDDLSVDLDALLATEEESQTEEAHVAPLLTEEPQTTPTPISAARLRADLRRWIGSRDLPLFITLTYDPDAPTRDRIERDLKEWDARLNRLAIGPRWHKRPQHRLKGLLVVESIRYSGHVHGVIRSPAGLSTKHFKHHARQIWRDITNGSALIDDNDDPHRTANYMVKQLQTSDDLDNVLILPRI